MDSCFIFFRVSGVRESVRIVIIAQSGESKNEALSNEGKLRNFECYDTQ